MFRHCRHPHGTYTKISLKPTKVGNYNKHVFVLMLVVHFWLKLYIFMYQIYLLI